MKLLEIKRKVDPAMWDMFQAGIVSREELELLLKEEPMTYTTRDSYLTVKEPMASSIQEAERHLPFDYCIIRTDQLHAMDLGQETIDRMTIAEHQYYKLLEKYNELLEKYNL